VGRPRFRQLAHTADCRLAVWGADEEEILNNGVAAALSVALARAPAGVPREWRALPARPRSFAATLVAVVNEALFLLYSRREVTVAVARRRGRTLLGTRPLRAPHAAIVEIKAATFHHLAAARRGDRLRATLTLDL
jgi:SHS2 domain-containing protein